MSLEGIKKIRDLWRGYWGSRVILTANNLGIFEILIFPKSSADVAKTLKLDERATEILLDALTGLGLLRKSFNKYRNTPLSNKFLLKNSPYYQGYIIKHADILWKKWSELDDIVKTGKPSRSYHDHNSFIRGMHNVASLKAKKIINEIDLKGVKKALDLGGGPGTYSTEMAKKGISVTLFDTPETIKIAKDIIRESNKKDINFIAGDFLVDDIGKSYDLVFISQVLHAYSERDCLHILEKSRSVLNSGGRIVIQEFYIDNSKTRPLSNALFSVNMLVNTDFGRCYSPKEIKGWLIKVGFKDIKSKLLDDSILISGINRIS
jgi:ubiquinone/menaquinone biosynthesis C-methylase UbiE